MGGNISTDLLMPALFEGETGGDFYRLVYGSQTALEIGLYDGQWFAMKDADGKQYLVQVYRDLNDPHRVQVPVEFLFDEKYCAASSSAGSAGLLEFHLEDAKEAPAAGFVPQRGVMQFTEGCQTLDQDIYGNELVLNDKVAEAGQQPLLKNLAHAAAEADQGTVTVTYGDTVLEPDRDYMVYTRDDEILIQGIGEYAGSIIL